MYRRTEERQGHVSLAKLRELAESGYLQPFDEICREGYADWEPISSLGILDEPANGKDSSSDQTSSATQIEIGGLIFKEECISPSSAVPETQPEKPSAYRLPPGQHPRFFTVRKRDILIGTATIILVSFGLVGAMVERNFRTPSHHDQPSGLIVKIADTPTLPVVAALPAAFVKPATTAPSQSSTLAAPSTKPTIVISSPPSDASTNVEEFQNQIMGDWKGPAEGMSLIFRADRAILSTDAQFFQILPYTLNPSAKTVLLHEAGGGTITLALGADNRLSSVSAAEGHGPLTFSRGVRNLR
jgi:hypothetical protein